MSNYITTARVQQYKTNVEMLLQQRGSKLAGAVKTESFVGKQASPVNQIGAVKAQVRSTRHADTPIIETPHDRRWAFPVHYEWGDMIDKNDNFETGISFDGPYAQNGAMAMGRSKDLEILKALFNDSKTGENGGTTTAFDTTNQQIAVGGAGLTYEKLIEGKKILMENEVDVENDPIYCAITAAQHENLLNELEVISMDYNTTPVLQNGMVQSFAGINFIHIEMGSSLLADDNWSPLDGSSDQRVPMWAKSGMCLGVWNDISVDIYQRGDKSQNVQVLVEGTFGATRLEEGKVVEIICDL